MPLAIVALAEGQSATAEEIVDYCRQDVALTRDLYLFGQKKNYLLFNNKAGNTVRIPVDW